MMADGPDMLALSTPRRAGEHLDLDAMLALVTAVDALLSASLVAQARPLVRELRAVLEDVSGPRARVINLGTARTKRET